MIARRPSPAVLVPLLVVLAAAGIRIWGLGQPAQPYWDETYYIYDANAYLGGGYGIDVDTPPEVRIAAEGTWVHPPLGKWMIALLGVGPFGLHPLGWRVPSVVFGVAGVLLLYLLALELWGSVWWAGLAGSLLALDGLHIVQSRLATLDIFVTTFITAGLLFLAMDRNRAPAAEPRRRLVDRLFGSPLRLGSGLMFGAAVATKWVGLFALAFGAGLCLVWVLRGSDRARRSRAAAVGTVAASFVLVPLLVYLLSYGAFFYQHGAAVHDFVTLQVRMFEYHRHHTQVQPQNSLPWTWPLLLHPIRYYGTEEGDAVRRVMALGNPALWWGFLALVPAAVIGAIRRPGWQDALVLGGFGALYLPWLFVGRSQFIFYLLPAVPLMCLTAVAGLRGLPARVARPAAIVFASVVLLTAAAFLPVWIGSTVSRSWIQHLRLLPAWDL
jgi:dolichyl-phosphate-mannose--protein O-mannosyl transferase